MINLMQGIACAYFDSIPTLFISGEPPLAHLRGKYQVRQKGFQEMDVIEIVRPLTKYAVLLNDPSRVKYELEKLIYLAFSGRPGPVLLDLPDDLQRAQIDQEKLVSFSPEPIEYHLDQKQLKRFMDLVVQAERPVAVIGGGVKLADTIEQTRIFLDKTKIPFVTTWATIDMFLDDTPNLIGNFGISANRPGNFAVQNADLIISLASRLDTHQTGSNPAKFAPQAKKIMIDIDQHELSKHEGMPLDLKVNCDIRIFLQQLNKHALKTKDLTSWRNLTKSWKERYPICAPENYKQKDGVNPYVFMQELSRETKEQDIIITDAGATLTWTMQAYTIRKPQLLFSAFNHSPMGYALCASIGAQFAAPSRRVICIIGDGGMQMNIQELETVIFNKLPIKIFLINNSGYGIIKQTQDTWLNSRYVAADSSSGLGFPDFQKIALSYGIKAAEIVSHKELNGSMRKVLDYNGPILCDVKLKPDEKITPKLEFGRPLEDLSPFLDRAELAEIMSPKRK
jgi:acetolactate synthase-1/2/3 large subunit